MKDIIELINDIEISRANQVLFRHQTFINSFNFSSEHTITEIQNLFYRFFFLKKTLPQSNFEGNKVFYSKLIKSNFSKDKFHKYWIIEHINIDGSIIVTNKDKRLSVQPGHYILTQNSASPQLLDSVMLYKNSEEYSDNDFFYHVFGEQLDENFYEAMVRFYFNLYPEGALKIISILTKKLNKLKIPFHFKCLKNSEDYTRADSGVLYLDKRYFIDFKPVLKEIINETKSYLKTETPLFTLKLHDGIGFAENPPNPNESFGMSRCRLIAEGIWQAHENKLPKSEWLNSICSYIKNQGYDLEKFYLNPNSRFPYDFN